MITFYTWVDKLLMSFLYTSQQCSIVKPQRLSSIRVKPQHTCIALLFDTHTWGPSIKYVMLIFANFDPLSHFVTHPANPQSTSHISDLPRFLVGLVQKTRTKAPCTNSLSIACGGFVQRVLSGGLLSGRFCLGWFLFVPPSVRIHLLKQKAKHHFKFHVSYVR